MSTQVTISRDTSPGSSVRGGVPGRADPRDLRRGLGLVGAPAAVLILLFIVPLVVSFYFSFRSGSIFFGDTALTLDTYRKFFANTAYMRLLAYSTLNAALVTVAAIVLAYPIAYYLAFRARWRPLVQVGVLVVPAMTSFLLRILAIKIILGSVDYLLTPLRWIGLLQGESPDLLYTREGVFITLVYVWIPFAALPIYASLTRISPSLFEGSADLGARPWRTFVQVTLPLSSIGVAAAAAYVFIPTLAEWVTPALIGGTDSMLFGNAIAESVSSAMDYPMGAVMANTVLALLLVFSVIVPLIRVVAGRRRRREGETP